MADSLDLTGSTGKMDVGGIYQSLLTAGIEIGKTALSGKNNQPIPSPAPAIAPASSFDWQKYLPLAIGAVVVIVILGFVFKRGK